MSFSIVRLLALAAPVAALAGCGGAPSTSSEGIESSSSALTISGLPILLGNPLTACTAIAASHTRAYSSETFTMGVDAPDSAGCDYGVMEVTGTLGQPVQISLTDIEPYEDGEPPSGVVDAVSCAASYATYETMGFVPPHWDITVSGATYYAGYWVEVSEGTGTISGTWEGIGCAFLALEDGTLPVLGGASPSPYETIRVAIRAILVEPSGDVWAPVYAYVGQ
jgi:hypothetical protein